MVKLDSRGACKQYPVIGQNYSNFFLLWLRSLRPRGLQITRFDWSELFQICALIWQGWRHMFSTALPRTLENHNERCINWHFFSFITKLSSTTKLSLPSSSQILAKISICSDYNPFQALFLFNSSDISQVYTMKDSANWRLLACGVSLYTIPWRHMVTYWICSLSWLVKLKARPGLKFQLRLRLRFRWNEDVSMNENQHMNQQELNFFRSKSRYGLQQIDILRGNKTSLLCNQTSFHSISIIISLNSPENHRWILSRLLRSNSVHFSFNRNSRVSGYSKEPFFLLNR